jgi:DNA-binding PadR family transcriptional regulator
MSMSKGRYLAEFELYVMLALARLEDTAYGVTIRQEIEERAGRPVSIGAVYATLGRLGDKGLVSFRTSDPLPVKGGRSRKYFRLTAGGQSALEESMAMLERMKHGLELDADSGRARK